MSALMRGTALTAAIAISLAGASRAVAQSMPNITAPKAAAANAAAATNAHIQAEQNPSQQSAPAKPAPRPAAITPPAQQQPVKTTAPAKGAAAAPAKGTPAAAAKGAAPASGAQANSVSQRGGKQEIALMRETFAYQAENRRDPFLSLMKTGDLRPMISDLRLVAVIYDPAGRSVAILRDLQTKEQYRVRVGQTLGRMRVNQIRPNQVIFTIEEIGMTRQEALSMNDITKARSQ
jgi:hypothetical protein